MRFELKSSTKGLNIDHLLEMGARGSHPLFETSTIYAAYRQDAEGLCRAVENRLDEVQEALSSLLMMSSVEQGRSFVARLPREIQFILVLLYFEALDERIFRDRVLH